MMMKADVLKKIVSVTALFLSLSSVNAAVAFDNLDLSADDNLIFSAENKSQNGYKSLFLTKLGASKTENSPQILTCYPEQMELLENGKILQIRNRYGKAFYDVKTQNLKWQTTTSGIPVEYSKTGAISVNSKGTFYCYVKKNDFASGELILVNASNFEEKIICENYQYSSENVNIKWSPSGNTFIYENNGKLYFETPEVNFKNIVLPENYRIIGEGKISSVEWTQNNTLLYINSDIIYKISENELYTRGLYSSLAGNGIISGRLPFAFNPDEDKFSVDSDGNQIVLLTSENMAYYYALNDDVFNYVTLKSVNSLTDIKGSVLSCSVFWNSQRKPLLWIDVLTYENASRVSKIFSIEKNLKPVLEIDGCTKKSLSPDRRFIAFNNDSGLYVYDISTWNQLTSYTAEKNVSFVWNSNYSIYAGGEKTVKVIFVNASSAVTEKLLFLSSCGKAYNDGGRIITTFDSKNYFVYVPQQNIWNVTSTVPENPECIEKNGKYRVFLGNSANTNYENSIFVRSLSGKNITYSVFSENLQTVNSKKKVTLIFDATDNTEGLAYILDVLKQYNIKATFFINGEFIRRYPLETKMIAESGNVCGSSFYTNVDLLSGSFICDSDFIKRGLARNEDEFFAVTGKELSLLWHAPFYSVNPQIKEYGKEAGYVYVDSSTNKLLKKYSDTDELLDAYVNQCFDGMVINIKVGKSSQNMYKNLDLLISSLLDSGATF